MFNVFTQRDFTHTFDELFEFAKARGMVREERRAVVENLWNYFVEEATVLGGRPGDGVPDRRTKAGKIRGELRARYGLSNAWSYSPEYRRLCRWENGLIKQEQI